jgi:hypothetical protein
MLRPGLLRGILGMILCGLAAAFVYSALAAGGIYAITALLMLLMGLLLGGLRGLFSGAVLLAPAYLFLRSPVPPQSAQFGTILLALIVFLGIVPGIIVLEGAILKRLVGAAAAAVLAVPIYITFLVAFPPPLGIGPNSGATLMFAGLGMAFGFVWGVGAASPGASSHEGPAYFAELAARAQPNPIKELRELALKLGPQAAETLLPLVRPLLITLGLVALVMLAVVFVATNPIVPVSRVQTNDAAASAVTMTGDKLLLFVVIIVVVLGAIATLAVLLALGVNLLNRQVNTAKKEPKAPVEKLPNVFRLFDFAVSWLADILGGLRRILSR